MKIGFFGLSKLTIKTVSRFLNQDTEVVIIESDRKKVEQVSDQLDCSFLIGDACQPSILKEMNIEDTNIYMALSDDDMNNMISGLVARSLGIRRIILRIDDPDYEEVCKELGFNENIIPSITSSEYLHDLVYHERMLNLFQVLKTKADFHCIKVQEGEEMTMSTLDLPKTARAICYFREGKFAFVESGITFKAGDEIILLSDKSISDELSKRFNLKSDIDLET